MRGRSGGDLVPVSQHGRRVPVDMALGRSSLSGDVLETDVNGEGPCGVERDTSVFARCQGIISRPLLSILGRWKVGGSMSSAFTYRVQGAGIEARHHPSCNTDQGDPHMRESQRLEA